MDIEVITSQAGFAGLRDEWNELLTRSATKHIFLTHEWQYTWWEHFGTGDKDLLILLARDGGRPVGIAPLRRDVLRVRGLPLFRVVSFLVGYEADYRDLLIEEGLEWTVLVALLAHLRDGVSGWHMINLTGVHGASCSNDIIPAAAKQQALHHHGQIGGACPYIKMPDTMGEFLSAMSRSTRAKFQQKLRKMQREQGDIILEVHCGEQVSQEDIDVFLNLHALSWRDRGGSKAVNADRVRLFHRDLLDSMRGTDWPLVATLAVEGKPCSVIYGHLYDGVFYDYLPGFDPSLERYSPGAQMLLKTVEHGIHVGWREIDLMRGDEGYKFHFTRRVRHQNNHLVTRSRQVLKIARLLEAVAG